MIDINERGRGRRVDGGGSGAVRRSAVARGASDEKNPPEVRNSHHARRAASQRSQWPWIALMHSMNMYNLLGIHRNVVHRYHLCSPSLVMFMRIEGLRRHFSLFESIRDRTLR
jgi:hypothetical protein